MSDVTSEGYLDRVDVMNGSLFGWAWRPDSPNEPVSVDLHVDDRREIPTVTTAYRADLEQAGKGNGRHGFQIRVLDRERDGKNHLFKVCYHETTIALYGRPRSIVVETATDRGNSSNRART